MLVESFEAIHLFRWLSLNLFRLFAKSWLWQAPVDSQAHLSESARGEAPDQTAAKRIVTV
jgi:hypothetical protein